MTAIASPRPGLWWGRPISELRWQLEWAALLADPVWRGVGVPCGDGSPVLLVPGFLSGDVSLRTLRTWLQRIGYRTYQADIRWNVDCADRAMVRLERRLTAVVQRTGRPVRVIGHSRGGLFARALVHRRPADLTEVITLGSPLANELDCSVSTLAAVAGARHAASAQATSTEGRLLHRKLPVCLHLRCTRPAARDGSADLDLHQARRDRPPVGLSTSGR